MVRPRTAARANRIMDVIIMVLIFKYELTPIESAGDGKVTGEL
jgi:hypothetical protein